MASGRFFVHLPLFVDALHLPAGTIVHDVRITDDLRFGPRLMVDVDHPDITTPQLEPIFTKASDGTVQFVRWTREEE